MTWSRPPGPPKVWRVIEVVNRDKKKIKFSLQEIPEDRYAEAVDHMITVFLHDEVLCSSISIADDQASVAALRDSWISVLKQGISVAAYEQVDDNTKPELAGVNMLELIDNNTEKLSFDEMPTKAKKVLKFVSSFTKEGDPRELYKVDRYLSAMGLSVDPRYRGLKLGQYLLEVRDDIGKTYDIPVSGTVFTSETSQKVAERAGFHNHITRPYDDVVDDKGEILFPALKGKQVKIMVKRL